MNRNIVEAVMGTVVLLVAGFFVVFVYNTTQVKVVEGYTVSAIFFKIGGLQKGSDVRLNGIKVGAVTSEKLDTDTFDAIVTMSIEGGIKLPTNSVAIIGSEGILGGKYVRIEPGNAKIYIADGGAITKTKDFRSLEDRVGDIIFLASGGDDKDK